jgi:hypothetical protein
MAKDSITNHKNEMNSARYSQSNEFKSFTSNIMDATAHPPPRQPPNIDRWIDNVQKSDIDLVQMYSIHVNDESQYDNNEALHNTLNDYDELLMMTTVAGVDNNDEVGNTDDIDGYIVNLDDYDATEQFVAMDSNNESNDHVIDSGVDNTMIQSPIDGVESF